MTKKFFEKRVMNVVRPVLGDDDRAGFYADSGCLFLECGLVTLSKVVRSLARAGVGAFKVNSVGDEFAIDFI